MSAKSTDFSKRLERVLENDAERNEFYSALRNLAEKPSVVLRKNRLRSVQAGEFQDWIQRPVEWSPDAFFARPELRETFKNHPYVQSGALYWQEGGATEAVEILDPQPDDWVCDLCAAPGSKATQIAERLARGRGWLVANEANRGRASKLQDILSRHGALWTTILCLSADKLAQRFSGVFDRVLLDAPCSGESFLAKREDDRPDVRDFEVRRCAELQQKLLENGLDLLRPGGHLLYSTCTYSREENEGVLESVAQTRPSEFQVVRQQRRWPHRDGVAGGFAALLQKAGESRGRSFSLENWDGVLSSGGQFWDASMNDYAWLMTPDFIQADRIPLERVKDPRKYRRPEVRDLALSETARAQAYLRGEALVEPGLEASRIYRVLYRDCPLGGGKAVEGRINTFLPKGLRVTG